jgi:hypothetical protein
MTTFAPEKLPLFVRRQQALATAMQELGTASLDDALALACAIGNMRIFEDDALEYFRHCPDLYEVQDRHGWTAIKLKPT